MKIVDERETKKKKTNKQTNKGNRSYSERMRAE